MDYSTSCRLCLSKEGHQFPIFGSGTAGIVPLNVRISSCLAIEVSQFDSLPKQICHKCESQVNVWHYFNLECQVSQKKLLSWLATLLSPSAETGNNEAEECERVGEVVQVKLEPEEVELENIDINEYTGCSSGNRTVSNGDNLDEIYQQSDESSTCLGLVISGTSSLPNSNCLDEEGDSVVHNDAEDNVHSFCQTSTNSFQEDHSVGGHSQTQSVLDVSLDSPGNDASTPINTYDTGANPDNLNEEQPYSAHVSLRIENSLSHLGEDLRKSAEASPQINNELAVSEDDLKFTANHTQLGSTPSQELASTKRKFVKTEGVSSGEKHKLLNSSKPPENTLSFNLNAVDLPKINNELFDENTKFCKVCRRTFPRSSLWRHMKQCHAHENPFKCEVCQKDFPGRRELREHRVRTVSKYCRAGKEPDIAMSSFFVNNKVKRGKYQCCECKMKFNLLNSVKAHVRLHKGEKPFFCYMCNEKEFSLRKTALKHVAMCKAKRDTQAPICKDTKPLPRIVSVPCGIKRKVVKQAGKDKTPKCGKCGKVFTSGVGMANHLRTECQRKCFSCSKQVPGPAFFKHFRQCFKSMHTTPVKNNDLPDNTAVNLQHNKSSSIDNAEVSGLKEDNSDFTKCNKAPSVRKNALLKVDMSLKDLWAKHLEVDGTLKSLICQLCDKTSKTRRSLYSHVFKHSAQAFRCHLCRVATSKLSSLSAHISSVHGIHENHIESNSPLQSKGGASALAKAKIFSGFKLSKLKCDVCSKLFSSASSLKYHKLSHKKVKCQKCELTFPAVMEKTHVCTPKVKTEMSNPEQEPALCQDQADKLPEKRVIQYTCHLCKKKFHTRKMLYQHKKMHIKMKIYKCKMCSNSYSDAGALKHHKEMVHADELALDVASGENKDSTTNVNDVKVKLESIADSELETAGSSKEKQWECTICHRDYSSKESLARHMKLHVQRPKKVKVTAVRKPSDPDLFYCSGCDRAFTSETSFKVHKGWHSRSENLAEISVKSETFATLEDVTDVSSANSSDAVTSPKTSFPCSICPREFSSQKSLRIHVHFHNYPKTSKETKKEAVSPSNQSQTETGNKCEICSKSFSDLLAYTSHMRSHSGSDVSVERLKQEPLQCKLCNKEYRTKKSLKYHMMGHSGEKPYKCRSCSNQYSNPKALAKHEKERHTIVLRPFSCHKCKTSFILKEDLLAHHEKCTH